MNFIEAVKSGKPFRRKAWAWPVGQWESPNGSDLPVRLDRDDVIADDWEIEEPAISLTRTQVVEAWVRALKFWGAKQQYSNGSITPIEELLKELGFPE